MICINKWFLYFTKDSDIKSDYFRGITIIPMLKQKSWKWSVWSNGLSGIYFSLSWKWIWFRSTFLGNNEDKCKNKLLKLLTCFIGENICCVWKRKWGMTNRIMNSSQKTESKNPIPHNEWTLGSTASQSSQCDSYFLFWIFTPSLYIQ